MSFEAMAPSKIYEAIEKSRTFTVRLGAPIATRDNEIPVLDGMYFYVSFADMDSVFDYLSHLDGTNAWLSDAVVYLYGDNGYQLIMPNVKAREVLDVMNLYYCETTCIEEREDG